MRTAHLHRPSRRAAVLALDPDKRIDVVAVSDGIEVVDATVQHDPALVPASDHRAVAVTLRLPQGSENS